MQMTLDMGAEHRAPTALEKARAAGDRAAAACADKSTLRTPEWRERATLWVLDHLQKHGPTSGEDLTDGCKLAGIHAHDDRAMGAVISKLVRDNLIEKYGNCQRRRGHGTAGGCIWRIKRKG